MDRKMKSFYSQMDEIDADDDATICGADVNGFDSMKCK